MYDTMIWLGCTPGLGANRLKKQVGKHVSFNLIFPALLCLVASIQKLWYKLVVCLPLPGFKTVSGYYQPYRFGFEGVYVEGVTCYASSLLLLLSKFSIWKRVLWQVFCFGS